MGLTAPEKELLALAQETLPEHGREVPVEMLAAAAKDVARARAQIDAWYDAAMILRSSTTDLDQHARDRGTRRQSGEADGALQTRLRVVEDAVTVGALLNAANAVLVGFALAGSCTLVELRMDQAHLGTYTSTGRARTYLSRGFRVGHQARPHVVIVIVPYIADVDTRAAVAAAVSEAVRRLKGGGIVHRVESRRIP